MSCATAYQWCPTFRPSRRRGSQVSRPLSGRCSPAPTGRPSAVVNKLNAELKDITASSEAQQQMISLGMVPFDTPSPDELKDFYQSEIVRWAEVAKRAGIAGSE